MKVVSAFILSCITWGLSSATNSTDCGQVDPSKPCHESREERARIAPFVHEDSDESSNPSSTRVIAGHLRGSASIFDKDDGAQGNLSGQKRRKRVKSGCSRGERVECNAFDNEFGNVFRKKILLCHYRGRGRYKTLCVAERSVRSHLQNHPNDYCGECNDATTTSTTTPPPLPTTPPPPTCYKGDRIECEADKISVCHFNKGENSYETVCMAEADVTSHLQGHDEDYYGECEQDIFVQNSVQLNIPPKQGSETHGAYEVEYNVTFNKDGIVVLGNSFDIIDGVLCSPSTAEILFSKPLGSGSLESMFPVGSILVVDGDLFGTECNFFSPREQSQESQSLNVGFLAIQSFRILGSIATIVGAPAVFDMIFQHQEMHYQDKIADGRKLITFSLDESIDSLKFTVPPDDFSKDGVKSPIQWKSDFVGVSGYVSVEKPKLSTKTRWGTDVKTIFGREVAVPYPYLEVGFSVELEYDAGLTFHGDILVSSSDKFELVDEPFDPIGQVDISTFEVPDWSINLLGLSENKLGSTLSATFHMPFSLTTEVASSFDGVLRYVSTISLGAKRLRVGIVKRLRVGFEGETNDLDSWELIKETLVNNNPDGSGGLISGNLVQTTASDSAIFSVVARLEAKPQLRLAVRDLGWIGAGNKLRFESVSAHRTSSFAPTSAGEGCDECHKVASELSLVFVDPFLTYKKRGKNTQANEQAIAFFYEKEDLEKICLLELEGHIPCGDVCCEPTDTCEWGKCLNALCLSECCYDYDCESPEYCNKVKGQCECPYECCDDSVCEPSEKVCDSFSHQCTDESHDINKPPLKILHLGDSYSSGTGAGQYSGPVGCYRSERNWGKLFSDTLKERFAVRFINRACSFEVKTDDYYSYKGLELVPGLPCPSPIEDEYMEEQGLNCVRFVQPQRDSVTNDVNVVVLTMGGNDLGFAFVALKCFFIGNSKFVGLFAALLCRDAVDKARNILVNGIYQEKFTKMLLDVTERMNPEGIVILSSYPQLLMDTEYVFNKGNPDYEYDAGAEIRQLALYFDEVQRATVDAVNEENGQERPTVHYFDQTKDVFDGPPQHEPDPSDKENPHRWMVEPFDGSAPTKDGGDLNEWYHPNQIGHMEWAKAISQWAKPIIAHVFDKVSSNENSGGGESNFNYCGTSWVDANAKCGTTCPRGLESECPTGEFCYAECTNCPPVPADPTPNGSNNIDLVFVIDATGSMGSYIASVKVDMQSIVSQIAATFQSFRIAIVTYRDFPPHSGYVYPGGSGDYPCRVELDFSDELAQIQSGINAITVHGGGDEAETALSGLEAALEMEWRSGVSKVVILMGDAPAKIINGKEPNSDLTDSQIIAKSEALDPVQIMAVELGRLLDDQTAVENIVHGTGGTVESDTGGVVAAIERILDAVSKQPFAWFGESMTARVGQPVLFDASGSFDPFGNEITSYEWDFNGDGIYDDWTDEKTILHTYYEDFNGFVALRVTSIGGVGFASAWVVANEDGSISQLSGEYCDVNETTALPILEDENGIQLRCLLNSTMWPDRASVNISVAGSSEMVDPCLDAFESPVISLQPCDTQKALRVIERQVETGDYTGACASMSDLVGILGNAGQACLDLCRSFPPL